jgi:ketosteroid isomerase-like protein
MQLLSTLDNGDSQMTSLRMVSLALLAFAVACANASPPAPPADHRAADEATIRGLDSAWAKAIADKNEAQALSYYADNALVLAPGAPLAKGTVAIKATWDGLTALPGFALTFGPTTIDVSGDRATEIGDYALTINDKSGKPQTTKAKYIVIWGKQADGSWKALVDAPTTTQ